jgi:hypothetical protein
MASSLNPEWLGSPMLWQCHEQILAMPKWNDFILCAMYDEYRTRNVGCIVDIGKAECVNMDADESGCELVGHLHQQQKARQQKHDYQHVPISDHGEAKIECDTIGTKQWTLQDDTTDTAPIIGCLFCKKTRRSGP